MQIQKILKKIIDYAVAFIGLIILIPLFLIVAIFIKLDSKGPVFFIQERVGKNGKIFKMFKFRTLFEGIETPEFKQSIAENDPRITKVGGFLRKWTIDELPQLINILRGEMNLVGPRPLPKYLIEKYSHFQGKRTQVLPGMVSLVETKGRNLVPFETRFEMDNWYIEHWSLFWDLKILFLIPFIVFSRKGVYGEFTEEEETK